MRLTIYFILFFCIYGCKFKPTEKMLEGKWKITSWINLKNKTDLMKDSKAPEFKVNFMKDTVYIIEKESHKVCDYSFVWELRSDTIAIRSIGNFYIDYLNDKKLVLTVNRKSIFSSQKLLYKEKITLIKSRN